MKKLILILSIILISNNINAQLENMLMSNNQMPGLVSGYVSGFVVTGLTYKLTGNKYISYAAGVLSSVGIGLLKASHEDKTDMYKASEVTANFSGGLLSILSFDIVINRPKKKKKLIEF